MPSRQRKHGGGKFKSERQRRYMWAAVPRAAKKWAHNRKTRKADWVRRPGRKLRSGMAAKRSGGRGRSRKKGRRR